MHLLSIIPERFIRALSTTFIYSLWQGVIIAAMAGLIVMLTRKSASSKRYDLLVGLLLLFAFIIAGTFVYQCIQTPVGSILTGAQDKIVALPSAVTGAASGVIYESKEPGILYFIDTHAELIVWIWLLIVCARSAQLLTGLHGLSRLRKETIRADEAWAEKLRLLVNEMGIRRQVIMAGSLLAKVPMVVGHFKPVILIPAALLSAMSPTEMETILVHELAHIKRRDYLVNMLQHLMEIVLFFNPAVLWISALIKTEREHCCDDITLKQTGDKAAYIRALIACQEFRLQTPKMAVALAGRNNLLGRVSRMVSAHNHSLSVLEKSFIGICVAAAAIILVAFGGHENKGSKTTDRRSPVTSTVSTTTSFTTSQEQTLPDGAASSSVFRIYKPAEVADGTSCYISNVDKREGHRTYLLKKANILYQLNYVNGELISMQQNGKDINKERWELHKKKIQQIKNKPDNGTGTLLAGRTADTAAYHDVPDQAGFSLRNGLIRTKDAIDEAGMALGRTLRSIEARRARQKTLSDKVSEQALTDAVDRLDYKPRSDQYYQPYQPVRTGTMYPAITRTGLEREYRSNITQKKWITAEELLTQFVNEGLAAKVSDIHSFMINQEIMMLNGQQVPAEVHRKILEKYIKSDTPKKWAMYYNFDTSTMKTISRNGINAG